MNHDFQHRPGQAYPYETLGLFGGESWKVDVKNKLKKSLLLSAFLFLVTSLALYKVILISHISITAPSFWTVYGVLTTLFLVSRIPYAYLHSDDHGRIYRLVSYPDVSVIITAKNEEKSIFKTISRCARSDYPGKLECIVVDDGSTDETNMEIRRAQETFDNVRLVTFEENMGKREAMAAGISRARYEIIVFVDSDSFLYPDALRTIAEHFLEDERVGAVSGNTKVENADKNILTRIQSIQYAVSFDVYKASESVHGSVTCCPGCFSAYRKSAIKPIVEEWKERKFLGTRSTYGDDRALTYFILKSGWKVIYCEKAKASTIVPESALVYLRQQLRWKKSWIREGLFASSFMWKGRNPLASLAFYTSFSFPFLGPLLAAHIVWNSVAADDPTLLLIFIAGFVILGLVFALFVGVCFKAKNWMYMPLVSLLFVFALMWLMPYALLTVRNTRWGTR